VFPVNYRAVLWLLGRVMALLAAFELIPAAVSWSFGEREEALQFLLAATLTAGLGWMLSRRNRHAAFSSQGQPEFHRREGLAAVGLTWLVVALVGAIPYLLTGAIPRPVDALFESTSGFTTTGATILSPAQIDGLPLGVQFWRCFSHWLGGFGIVLVFVVFFPTGGRSLFRSEVPGIRREAGQQRVRDSARALARIYVGLTVLEMLALLLCGLEPYEAVVHAFSTIATGGFAAHSDSVAYFSSISVELIILVFMVLAGMPFGLYDLTLRRGLRKGWSAFVHSTEIRVFVGLLLGSIAVISGVLWFWGGSNGLTPPPDQVGAPLPDYSSLGLCLRDASFAVAAIQTSTGFATADFDRWPELCRLLLMGLGLIGGCAGSTAGGLKVARFVILVRAAIRGVLAFSRPRAVHTIRIDGEAVDEGVVASVMSYVGLWILVFVGGSLFLTALNVELLTAWTSVLACLNNIGPGLGAVGPIGNFSEIPTLGKGLLSLFMVLGRLEFYALVVLFVPRFWRS
jgi:trk system potassium uptake protein TrkH